MENKNNHIFRISGDIVSIFEISNQIGWKSIKEINIYRIIYISSVLYSFKFPDRRNPFSIDYKFIITLRGPYTDNIEASLDFLEANKVLHKDQNGFAIDSSNAKRYNLSELPDRAEKKSWIQMVMYILGVYGEEKIYDFVFRDPEYQDSVQRNSVTNINLDVGNQTYESLMSLKRAFEDTLGDQAKTLDTKKYMELYFEYVFSKILKGETD